MTRRPLPAFRSPTSLVPASVLVGALAVALTGCGVMDVGPRETEERAVEGVTAVELRTSGSLTITQGKQASLEVTAGEEVLSRLTSDVRGDVLVLGFDDGPRWGGIGLVEYDLVLPDLRALTVLGSGDVAADAATGDDLTIAVDGSGDVDVDGVDVGEVVLRIAGSGDVRLSGRADEQTATVDGSGEYDGSGLTSTDAVVSVQGSGDVTVDVTGTLDASVSGSGSIVHTGGAKVSSTVSGSGDVIER